MPGLAQSLLKKTVEPEKRETQLDPPDIVAASCLLKQILFHIVKAQTGF
jgi:hypothetical protein